MEYLHYMDMSYKKAINVWTRMYQHVLFNHRSRGQWLFIHYNQVLNGEKHNEISEITLADLDMDIIDPTLNRSLSVKPIPDEAQKLYAQLCYLSNYQME